MVELPFSEIVTVYWPIVHGTGTLVVLALFSGAKSLINRRVSRERWAMAFAWLLTATLLLILDLVLWPFYRFGCPLLRTP